MQITFHNLKGWFCSPKTFCFSNSSNSNKRLLTFIAEKKRDSNKPDSIDCTPPDYILPGSTQRPLLPLHPGTDTIKVNKIRSL